MNAYNKAYDPAHVLGLAAGAPIGLANGQKAGYADGYKQVTDGVENASYNQGYNTEYGVSYKYYYDQNYKYYYGTGYRDGYYDGEASIVCSTASAKVTKARDAIGASMTSLPEVAGGENGKKNIAKLSAISKGPQSMQSIIDTVMKNDRKDLQSSQRILLRMSNDLNNTLLKN